MRLEQLTFTRFLAAIAVVTFHYGRGSVLMDNETLGLFFHQALYGVSYFFILSGFVMMIAYSNKEVKAKKVVEKVKQKSKNRILIQLF